MRQRGSSLLLVLSVLALLFTLGGLFLGMRVRKARAAQQSLLAEQARCLALSGLEDARAKLSKDLRFPPSRAVGQYRFSYAEQLQFPDSTPAGTYQVTVDWELSAQPHGLIRVTSVGLLGPTSDPIARRVLYAEWDASERVRSGPPSPNPFVGDWCYFEDRG